MVHPECIIAALNEHGVRYIVIGGIAATLHGCPEQTFDLDIFRWIPGAGDFHEAAHQVEEVDLGMQKVLVLSLTALIAAKEAAADPNPRKQSALAFLKKLQARGSR